MNTENIYRNNNCQWFAAVVAVVLTFFSIWAIASIQYAVPEFEPLFEGFGAKLPEFTEFVLSYYIWGWFFPVLGLLSCAYFFITWSTETSSRNKAFFISVFAFAISFAWREITIVGLYLPILKMGNVV